MYRAFNVELPKRGFTVLEILTGRTRMAALGPAVQGDLRSRLRSDGSLDGSALRSDWFPEVKCHIFVSHSHRDEEAAFGLAGRLYLTFGLTGFVDSGLWGDADVLLREIDDEHCWNRTNGTFSYEKRNRSTAHVHALLSTALSRVIDRSECVFFLNTKASVPLADGMDKTDSPWIFSEVEAANRMRRRSREEHRREPGEKVAKAAIEERDLSVLYDLDLDAFADMSGDVFDTWAAVNAARGHSALDALYGLVPLPGRAPLDSVPTREWRRR